MIRDDLIESKTNKKIKEIFKEEGESYFRELEQECANWIEASVDHTLISCGGGFYQVENIKKLGKVGCRCLYDWIYHRYSRLKMLRQSLKNVTFFGA